MEEVPFEVTGLDFDNGSGSSTRRSSPGLPTREIFFPLRPLQEERPGDRRVEQPPCWCGFYYRYDAPTPNVPN